MNNERNDAVPKSSFKEMMHASKTKMNQEHLNRLFQQIGNMGEQLSKHRTLQNLLHYKKLVQQFVQEAVDHGLKWTEKQGYHPNGSYKTYHLVEEIDERLNDLTNAIIEDESDQLKLLATIGEIEGLLVNLYA